MNTHITIIVSTILSVLSTFTAITSGEPSPSQPLPKFLTGTWIVKTAKINKTVGELYMGPWPNDPRYVGRTFDFGTDKVTSTAPEVHADCLAPTIRSERMTVADAFRHGMEDDVTPGDFDVPINADSVVSIYQIECNTQLWYRGLMRADSKKPKVIDGPWIIELPNSQIGMPWLDSVFLTLERLPANSIPTA